MNLKGKIVYVVGNQISYASWLENAGMVQTRKQQFADLVLFTGGEDVGPNLYMEEMGMYTSINSIRDNQEMEMFKYCFKNNIPMLGICRGGQFLTVMSGGKLVQHSQHPSNHFINTYDGRKISVTSSHHQQFLLDEKLTTLIEDVDYNLIGWADNLSPYHMNGKNLDYGFLSTYKEPEVVYFKTTNSLAIQSHPEWMSPTHETVVYFQELVNKLLNKTIAWAQQQKVEKELV